MRMKKLKLLGKSLLLAAGLTAFAAQAASIDVRLSDGSLLSVEMQDQMQGVLWNPRSEDDSPVHLCIYTGSVNYNDSGVLAPVDNATDPGIIWFDMEVEKIGSIQFNNFVSSVGNIASDKALIHISNGVMTLSGVITPMKINIVDVKGISVYSNTINSDTSIDINQFGGGMYVVTAGSDTFKLLVK